MRAVLVWTKPSKHELVSFGRGFDEPGKCNSLPFTVPLVQGHGIIDITWRASSLVEVGETIMDDGWWMAFRGNLTQPDF